MITKPTYTQTGTGEQELADFTGRARSALAICIGIFGAFVALGLLKLIGLFTNLFYFQRWSTQLISTADNHLGWIAVLVPVLGALVIGVTARFGSERIRGHGIPEAIESIFLNGSRVHPKLAPQRRLPGAT